MARRRPGEMETQPEKLPEAGTPEAADFQRVQQEKIRQQDEYKKAAANPSPPPTPLWEQMKQEAGSRYNTQSFGYNPYLTSSGPRMTGMNYNPYQTAARNASQSGAVNQFASQQSQLQQTGGLSAADRMKAFSDFNRQKILGQLGGAARLDQTQSQNQLDVGRFNAQRDFDVQRANIMAQNDAARDLAQANLRRSENLYQGGVADRNLGRQLEAAKIISQSQMRGGPGASPGILDRIMSDPIQILSPIYEGHKRVLNSIF